MSAHISTLQKVTRLVNSVTTLVGRQDPDMFDRDEQKRLVELKRMLADARLDVRDYEMADSKAEMIAHGQAAVQRLEAIRSNILKASEAGVFSAIDVAEVTADIEGIISEVQESL